MINKYQEFIKLSNQLNLRQIGSDGYEFRVESSFKTISLVAIIHGNEVGGLDTLIHLLQMIKLEQLTPALNVRFILGNVPAYYAGKRFIETDLNRSFSVSNPVSMEEKRAAEIQIMLSGTTALIDLHQTIGPTLKPFFIFPFNIRNIQFARAADPTIPIVTYKASQSAGTGEVMTWKPTLEGVISLTLETGKQGSEDNQTILGSRVIIRALDLLEQGFVFEEKLTYLDNLYTWSETITNKDFKLELVERFDNFQKINVNQVVATGGGSTVSSSSNGFALFPKYDEYRLQTIDLMKIIKKVTSYKDIL